MENQKPTHVFKISTVYQDHVPSFRVHKIAITKHTEKLIYFAPTAGTGYARSVRYPLGPHSGFFLTADEARADLRTGAGARLHAARAVFEAASKEIPEIEEKA